MDQVADLLTRIKNASLVNKYEITVSYSKIKEAILNILKNEGFIAQIEVTSDDTKKNIKFKISDKKSPSHLRQISKPGRRIYTKSKEIPKPLRGLGTIIISTSNGLTTGREAKKLGLGGEVICEIW